MAQINSSHHQFDSSLCPVHQVEIRLYFLHSKLSTRLAVCNSSASVSCHADRAHGDARLALLSCLLERFRFSSDLLHLDSAIEDGHYNGPGYG